MVGDLMTVEGFSADGHALIKPVMHKGRHIKPIPTLNESREHALAELARLPNELKTIQRGMIYPVEISLPLRDLAAEVDERSSG